MTCVYYWFQGRWCKAKDEGRDLDELRDLIRRAGYVARIGVDGMAPTSPPFQRELKMLETG